MSVDYLWSTYKDKVIPETAGSEQIEETKKAFYAGGIAVLSIIRKIDPKNPMPAFSALEDELLAFPASLAVKDATIN